MTEYEHAYHDAFKEVNPNYGRKMSTIFIPPRDNPIDDFLRRDVERLVGYFKAAHKPDAPVELEVNSDKICVLGSREDFRRDYVKAIESLQEKVKGRDIVSLEVKTPIDDIYRDTRFIAIKLTAPRPWAGDKWEYKTESFEPKNTMQELEGLGNEGWELCGCMNIGPFYNYYFKRLK